MIFVTVGTQKFQFNRLLAAIDNMIEAGEIQTEVFAQIGYSDYVPKNYKFEKFIDRTEFNEQVEKAEIIITHGGTGVIVNAIKKNKRVIAVPRLQKFGEHVDDHQLQIVNEFENSNLILMCLDCNNISELINYKKQIQLSSYTSNTFSIVDSIDKYISCL